MEGLSIEKENINDKFYLLKITFENRSNEIKIPNSVEVSWNEYLDVKTDDKVLSGTFYVLLRNTIDGLKKPFTKNMMLKGTGYKIEDLGDNKYRLMLGKSHKDVFTTPEDIDLKILGPSQFVLSCKDKQKLGNFAKYIESFRYPNVYSGTGIHIENTVYFKKNIQKK